MSSEPPATWVRDPVLWGGALLGLVAHALVFFAGEYLPYIDWSNHIGLISVFAHGDETGSFEYLSRSWAPNPYFLFYFTAAVLAQILPVVTAGKICLLIASLGMTLATAHLLEAHGRDPRMAVVAPAALFGQALGYGMASFVFAMPLLLWSLAELEYLLIELSADELSKTRLRRRTLRFAIALVLAYLGHALIFIATTFVVAVRIAVFVLFSKPSRRRALGRAVTLGAIAFSPAVILGLIRLTTLWLGPARVTETTPGAEDRPWLEFPEWSNRWNGLRWDLLDRGSSDHFRSMYAIAIVFGLIVVWRFFRSTDRPRLRGGYAAVAIGIAALWVLGPNSLERPFSVWLFYSRFGTLAALAIFGWPRARLRSWPGIVLMLGMLGGLGYDAWLQRGHVLQHQETAKSYDAVRAAIPPRSRILALSYGTKSDDAVSAHVTLRSLYFYHLADGAAYTAYLFDSPLIPVQHRTDVTKPRAPFWRTQFKFDPNTDGLDYDLLILRGQPVGVAKKSLHHRLKAEINGWSIFETLSPPKWPSDKSAP